MPPLPTTPHALGIPLCCSTALTVAGQSWTVWYPDDCAALAPEFSGVLTPLLGLSHASIRLLTIVTVPLHCAIDPATRTIRLASANVSRELFLLDQWEQDIPFRELIASNPALTQAMQAVRTHVEALQSIDHSASVWREITQLEQLPPLDDLVRWVDIYASTARTADTLAAQMRRYRPALIERLSDFALGLASDHAVLRIHLLRLIAVLPSLDHDTHGSEVARLARETLRRLFADAAAPAHRLPWWLAVALRSKAAVLAVLPDRWSATLIRNVVRFIARRFIAGESIDRAAPFLQSLFASQRDVTLDQLGELVVANVEADNYCAGVLELIHGFAQHVPRGARNRAGILRAHVSIKCSALTPDFLPHAPADTYAKIAPRLRAIFRAAVAEQVFINIDAEHYHYRDLTLYCLRRALLETPELHTWDGVGIVVQAYLRDGAAHFRDVLQLATDRGIRMPVRLVKGAYWDAETIEAAAHNFPAPQFLNKEETDLHFRQLVALVLAAHDRMQLCLASHNVQDHAFAECLRTARYPDAPIIEHECLHGTYEALSLALAQSGLAVRNYTPIGSLLVGMAYLVRRILENSSQVGVLTIMRSHSNLAALPTPHALHAQHAAEKNFAIDPTGTVANEFRNVSPVRLYHAAERTAAEHALGRARKNIGVAREPAFGLHGDVRRVTSPSDPQLTVGTIPLATADDVEQALQKTTQHAASGTWSRFPVTVRAAICLRAALLMTIDRLALAGLIVLEGGKTMLEALADVDEAIDFLAFYARSAAAHARSTDTHARGVAAVIAPWNFPLAIPCGMLVAPLVTGNTVLLKPAEPTPLITHELIALLHRAGVPTDALIHLPGSGKIVGAALVADPRVASIVFTGSKTVGLWIAHTAGQKMCPLPADPTRRIPAKVITEMGGKNAIIVTNNADLDETLAGVLYSAFAHAGQKCSAASRVLVDEKILDRFLARFALACQDLTIGASWDTATTMNPVISMAERDRLRDMARKASAEAAAHGGRVVIDRTQDNLPGAALGPCVVLLPAERATDPDSLAMQELFGPIIHVIPFRTLAQAVDIANATEYALTGGVFSQSQDDIDYVLTHLQAGNLYVNRPITGARVAIEPFGGFKHSGTGPKAGSPHYVPAFALTDSHTAPILHLPGTRPNRTIPGQLSYDDYSLTKRRGVLWALTDLPSARAQQQMRLAKAVDAQVTLIAHSPASRVAWNKVIADPQLTCREAEMPTAADLAGVDFLIIDGGETQIAQALQWIHGQSGHAELIMILTPFDSATLEQFILLRSCAINTMRYGAPLTLDAAGT